MAPNVSEWRAWSNIIWSSPLAMGPGGLGEGVDGLSVIVSQLHESHGMELRDGDAEIVYSENGQNKGGRRQRTVGS